MELSLIMADQHESNSQEIINEQTQDNCQDERVSSEEDPVRNIINMSSKKGKQMKQLNLNFDKEGVITTTSDNHDKNNRVKGRKGKDTGPLSDLQSISSRLRSHSGKVYTTSVSVENTGSRENNLTAVQEEDKIDDTEEEHNITLEEEEMCPKEKCCQGTNKLISMISKLQKSMDGVLKRATDQEIVSSNTSHKVDDLEEQINQHNDDIDDLSKELHETKFRLQIVSNIVIKQDEQIGFLKQKINEMQKREMSGNIVITGIPEEKQEKPIQLFNTFIEKGLEIREMIPANKAYRIGAGQNRPLIVELRHPENKGKIFSNATKLKGKVNEKGKPYFVAEQLPEEMNEKRRRMNELVSENKKKPNSHRLDMSFQRGQLMINEELYHKHITPPSAKELLNPDESLYDKADELDIIKGKKEEQEKSRFISYAVAVDNLDEVQAALLKVRMKFADATHVSCAYRIPGVNTPKNQDYIDDGEHGCGRTMLKVLKEEQLLNIAVIIVRYYGGKHLGIKRFDIFRNLAQEAIKALMKKRQQENSQRPPVSPLPDKFRPFAAPPPPITEEWANITEETSKKTD